MATAVILRPVTAIYTAAAHVAATFASLWMRSRGRWSTESVAQRRGRGLPRSDGARPIWIHAASMGEVRVGSALAHALDSRGQMVLGSAMTESGYEQLRRIYPHTAIGIRAPFDFPTALARVYDTYNPRALVLIETEWWPNLILAAGSRDVPVFVVNGRISDRAFKWYSRSRAYWRHALGDIVYFYMRFESDADRLRRLGIDESRIGVFGSMKSGLAPATSEATREIVSRLLVARKRVWIAGSTRPGEEELVLRAHRELKSEYPDLQLWIAPRHPHRFSDVAKLVQSAAFNVIRWSELSEGGAESPDVVLVDRMGVLPELYQFADVALVGGSLKPFGGHNPLEPALVGTPVIIGPHMQSQHESAELLLRENLAETVADVDEIVQSVGLRLFHGIAQSGREARAARLREHVPDVTRTIADDLCRRIDQRSTRS